MKEQDRVIVEQALKILRDELGTAGVELTSPAAAGQYCQLRLGDREHEVFLVVFLDSRHRVTGDEEMFRGTIDGASVYPREVAKAALLNNAAAVIFAHNHPSGTTEPSMADQAITRRLTDALALLEIRVLDHFVVSQKDYTSMASRGMI